MLDIAAYTLAEDWYKNRHVNMAEESKRILLTAVKLIKKKKIIKGRKLFFILPLKMLIIRLILRFLRYYAIF